MLKSEPKTVYPASAAEWRLWLQENHSKENAVWLVFHKVKSGIPSVSYDEAVDEALCFGWIDSKAQSVDQISHRQFFSKRKPKSVWSRVNKAKIAKLMEEGRMTEAGIKCIETAKMNGSWTILDEVEELRIPDDLKNELEKFPEANKYFELLSRSTKRNMLQWLVMAKKEETRKTRISEIVEKAKENKKPEQF